MTLNSVPWLEIAVLTPLVGAAVTRRAKTPSQAHLTAAWISGFSC